VRPLAAAQWIQGGLCIHPENGFMSKDEPESQDMITDAEPIDDIPIELLGEPQTLELSDRDMEALLEAIANPPPPNEAVLRAIARWRAHGSPARAWLAHVRTPAAILFSDSNSASVEPPLLEEPNAQTDLHRTLRLSARG
jgi:hypothetical protein